MKANTYESIILKKQPMGEGDELVTLLTRENGKMRMLAKSLKLPKSRLQHALQALFCVRIEATSGQLPKIIGAQVINSFPAIRSNLEAAKMALYAQELALGFTPDEERNEQLYEVLKMFLLFLDAGADDHERLRYGLEKFKIDFLTAIGLSPSFEASQPVQSVIGFSASRGGFLFEDIGADLVPINPRTYELFFYLLRGSFMELAEADLGEYFYPSELSDILSSFIRFQLERDIKAEGLLKL